MLEKDIQRQILRWLNSQRGVYAFKVAQGIYSQQGISDILACVNSKFYAFEVKTKTGRATALQKAFLKDVIDAGGKGFIVRSLDKVKTLLNRLIKRKFTVSRTSLYYRNDKPCNEAIRDGKRWTIDIKTLEELINFVDKYEHIILSKEYRYNGYDYYNIEIYDDYREWRNYERL